MLFGKKPNKTKNPLATLKKSVGTSHGAPINVDYAPDGSMHTPMNYEQRDCVPKPGGEQEKRTFADAEALRFAFRKALYEAIGNEHDVELVSPLGESDGPGCETKIKCLLIKRAWYREEKVFDESNDALVLEYRPDEAYATRPASERGRNQKPMNKVQCLADTFDSYVSWLAGKIKRGIAGIDARYEAEAAEPELIVRAKWALHKLREAYADNGVSHVMLETQMTTNTEDEANFEAERRIAKVTEAYRTFCRVLDSLTDSKTNAENLWNIAKEGERLNTEYMTRVT
ncbi:MAG: hypothetical protein K8953_08280 [Proteobacteria bacterium]|nr:hypothetical protein [Pseudomonadota bacterium]